MKAKFALAICLTVLAGMSTSAFADTSATIPKQMPPGTIITYDENGKMTVHEPNLSQNSVNTSASVISEEEKKKIDLEEKKVLEQVRQEAKSLPVYYLSEPELPAPQPGMTVYYDGMGLPTKVLDANGNIVDTPSKIIRVEYPNNFSAENITPQWDKGPGVYTYGDCKITITETYVLGEGWVTWYDGVGKVGADGKILTNENCATKMSIDNPPYNSEIRVRNLSNDKVGYVYKADVGSLPNAVLDIMPDKMRDTFGAPVDKEKGTGRFNGRTYHMR